MRAARNFQEEFVRTFRIPVQDTLAGSVMPCGGEAMKARMPIISSGAVSPMLIVSNACPVRISALAPSIRRLR